MVDAVSAQRHTSRVAGISGSASAWARQLLLVCLFCATAGILDADESTVLPQPTDNFDYQESAKNRGSSTRVLRMVWFHWDPYQYRHDIERGSTLSGLDIEIIRKVAARLDYRLIFEQETWEEGLRQIRTGEADLLAGAFYTPERAAYAWYSQPYRQETVSLIHRRGDRELFSANSKEDLIRLVAQASVKVGIVDGYFYGPEASTALTALAARGNLERSAEDGHNLTNLIDGTIDCFFSDRLAAYSMAWRSDLLHEIQHHPNSLFEADIHVLISRKTRDEAFVEKFNQQLTAIAKSGEYNQVARAYLVPVLLGITVHSTWFFVLDMIGTIAFAFSGVLLARKENYDIFGAFVLASLPAMGGGVLRDLLTERLPIGILRPPGVYLYAVIATVVIGALCFKIYDLWLAPREGASDPGSYDAPQEEGGLLRHTVTICDALGLAAFTVTGVVIAIEQRCEPLYLWGPILAALTGAGGGILRDIVRADSHNPSLKGTLYPEIALLWGFLLTVFLDWQTSRLVVHEVMIGVCVTIIGVLITRLLVVRYGWRSWMFGRIHPTQPAGEQTGVACNPR